MTRSLQLPSGVKVFERGWLSSNCVLFDSPDQTVLVDSGYSTHAPQTLELVAHALGSRPLDVLLNTHLHSDHCGGNQALQARYPALRTAIPPGQAHAVASWDAEALSYAATGQRCDRFRFDELIRPGQEWRLGGASWQVHAAPGHDPHSIVLFEPASRALISADALWQNGFGIVFPELEGEAAFDDVAATLDLIERLAPAIVIPGHGSVFGGREALLAALERARSRLGGFVRDPQRHAAHATKVLIKFKVLEWQRIGRTEFVEWVRRTPYMAMVRERYFGDMEVGAWLDELLADLVRAQAVVCSPDEIRNL